MFTPRALYHPYKPTTPRSSPAGFRFVDYINPRRCFNVAPDFLNTPSPLSSPIRGPRRPGDNSPPTPRPADPFAGDGRKSPLRPSTPTPEDRPKAFPKANETNYPTPDPSPIPPRRKVQYGPKRLSFNNGANRSGIVPHHRRAQQLKEKRDALHKRILDHRERRATREHKDLSKLRREAEALMTPEHMDDEDKIFLKQLENLELDETLNHDLEQCRQRMARAAAEAAERQKEHKARDENAAKMWGECQDAEAWEEQKRKVAEFVRAKDERREARFRRMEQAAMRADEERRRVHEAMERKIREEQERLFHEELARKAEEEARRRREEEERRLREERARKILEEFERRLQEERARKLQEERERRIREAQAWHERFMREERERILREERERQARLAEQARRAAQREELAAHQHFAVYEGKWNELRTSHSLPPIGVQEMPWPVFGVVSSADQITYQSVRTFLLHPQRPGVEGKTARDKVKAEVLRFHPDKFNTRILPKIHPSQTAVAQAIAEAVAKILTRIMTEEVEKQI